VGEEFHTRVSPRLRKSIAANFNGGHMTGWFPQHDLGKEDLAVQAKWARRLAVVYASALLLLVAFVAASRMPPSRRPAWRAPLRRTSRTHRRRARATRIEPENETSR
jgi:hypothetical protein